jgi:hypothetical protein
MLSLLNMRLVLLRGRNLAFLTLALGGAREVLHLVDVSDDLAVLKKRGSHTPHASLRAFDDQSLRELLLQSAR